MQVEYAQTCPQYIFLQKFYRYFLKNLRRGRGENMQASNFWVEWLFPPWEFHFVQGDPVSPPS